MVIYQKFLPRTKKRGVFYLSLKISSLNRLASYDEYPPGVWESAIGTLDRGSYFICICNVVDVTSMPEGPEVVLVVNGCYSTRFMSQPLQCQQGTTSSSTGQCRREDLNASGCHSDRPKQTKQNGPESWSPGLHGNQFRRERTKWVHDIMSMVMVCNHSASRGEWREWLVWGQKGVRQRVCMCMYVCVCVAGDWV